MSNQNTSSKKNSDNRFKHLDFAVLDIVVLISSFYLAVKYRFNETLEFKGIYRREMLIIAFSFIVVNLLISPYKNILKRGFFKELFSVIKQAFLMMLMNTLCLFFIHESELISRLVVGYIWVFYGAIVFVVRFFWKAILRSIHTNRSKKDAAVIITSSQHAAGIIKDNANPFSNTFTSALFLSDLEEYNATVGDEENLKIEKVPVKGSVDDVVVYVCHNWVDSVVIDIEDSAKAIELSDIFTAMGIKTHIVIGNLNAFKDSPYVQYPEKLGNYLAITQEQRIIPVYQIIAKRILDICGGIVGCIITGILFIFVAPVIYIKSPGPIFFTQKRIGKNGREFKIYKFRSMYMDAEERKAALMAQNKHADGMMFKMDDDPRIIGSEKKGKDGKPKGIGNFIRNTSIDEFPQFFNVLKGDMSLVGTRPPTLNEWEKYNEFHRARMSIKPGITGMWQISGRSEITDFNEVVSLDTEYIRTWTIGLDIKILWKTVLCVLKREGAE